MRVTLGDDRWCSSMELSYSASLVIRVIFSSFASFSSLGRMTWLVEYRNIQCRCSHESRNQIIGAPSYRVAMSRKERLKDPHGKYGELVKIFITTTRVTSATKGSTFTWSEWQKMVTIPSFLSPTPSVMRIAIGVISSLLTFLLEQEMKSTPAWSHTLVVTSLAKSSSDTTQKWMSTHLQGMIGPN